MAEENTWDACRTHLARDKLIRYIHRYNGPTVLISFVEIYKSLTLILGKSAHTQNNILANHVLENGKNMKYSTCFVYISHIFYHLSFLES